MRERPRQLGGCAWHLVFGKVVRRSFAGRRYRRRPAAKLSRKACAPLRMDGALLNQHAMGVAMSTAWPERERLALALRAAR